MPPAYYHSLRGGGGGGASTIEIKAYIIKLEALENVSQLEDIVVTSAQLTAEECDNVLLLLLNIREKMEAAQRGADIQKLRLISSSTAYQLNRIRNGLTEDHLDSFLDVLNELAR